jgi:hypothetical protein
LLLFAGETQSQKDERAKRNKARQDLHKKLMPWVYGVFAVYSAYLSFVAFLGMVRV